MTCVVGMVHRGKIYLGGDSASVDSSTMIIDTVRGEKVFRHGKDYLIGFAGSWRAGQLLQYVFSPPRAQLDMTKIMVSDFVPRMRSVFIDGGVKDAETECDPVLVGVLGRLFEIDGDYHVSESRRPYAAIGSGARFAIGVMAASTGKPEDRVMKALRVSEENSAGVRAPFYWDAV